MAEGGGGKSDIEAGRAYVELFLKDAAWSKGIEAASAKLKDFGKGLSIFGATVTAIGASVTAPLVEMAREFANSAKEITDMAERTGKSVEQIQMLQYAAEQTGTDMQKLQKAMFEAAKEGKNFDALAAKVVAVRGPTAQLQAAIKEFGAKAGPAILPLLRQLPQLREQFERLGLVTGKEDIESGEKLKNSWLDLAAVIRSARDAVAVAIVPALIKANQWMISVAISIRDWIASHRELFQSIFQVAKMVTLAGTAIIALGGFFIFAGAALSGFNALLGVAAGFLGALVSPLGLIVGGLVGLATWFVTSTNAGRAMVQGLIGWFGNLLQTAKETWQGISDALAAGNLALAAKVAWAGLKVEWAAGINSLTPLYSVMTEAFHSVWAGLLELSNAGWSGLERGWIEWSAAVGDIWDSLVVSFKTIINDIVGFFAEAWAWLTGRSIEALERIKTTTNEVDKTLQEQRKKGFDARHDAADAALKKNLELENGVLDVIGQQLAAKMTGHKADEKAAADRLAAAKAELAALTDRAAKERKDKELAGAPGFKAGQFNIGDGLIQQKIFGSFSAAALTAGGGVANDPVTKELREQRHIHLMALRNLDLIRAYTQKGFSAT